MMTSLECWGLFLKGAHIRSWVQRWVLISLAEGRKTRSQGNNVFIDHTAQLIFTITILISTIQFKVCCIKMPGVLSRPKENSRIVLQVEVGFSPSFSFVYALEWVAEYTLELTYAYPWGAWSGSSVGVKKTATRYPESIPKARTTSDLARCTVIRTTSILRRWRPGARSAMQRLRALHLRRSVEDAWPFSNAIMAYNNIAFSSLFGPWQDLHAVEDIAGAEIVSSQFSASSTGHDKLSFDEMRKVHAGLARDIAPSRS